MRLWLGFPALSIVCCVVFCILPSLLSAAVYFADKKHACRQKRGQKAKDKGADKRQDKENFGFEGNILLKNVKELLRKQEFKCYVCDDNVITSGWKPNCLYQFTLDRLNNSLPHNRDNCLICCYYCNCKDIMLLHTEDINDFENIKNKICKNKCHCNKRLITSNRNNISKEKIEGLKLT